MDANVIESVSVALGDRSYDILIGTDLLATAADRLKSLLSSDRVIIITDENVAPLYLDTLEQSFALQNITVNSFVLPAGEATKSFSQYESLMNDLLALKLSRKDTLIALGGGVIGDLVGFAASTLLRGLPFIQIPTTLLSQVDSSVGGKTGINTAYGKNLIGAFYQPKAVLIDLDALKTLPHRELLAGYAEVVKYGLIDNADFFSWLEDQGEELLNGCQKRQAHAVATSCRAKSKIVSEDEHENGRRALLNLGHTFGHALEAECGYDGSLLHGEAVSIGMCLAFQASVALELCSHKDADRVSAHLKSVGLQTKISDINIPLQTNKIIANMATDKKVDAGLVVFILATHIGSAMLKKGIDDSLLQQVIDNSHH